MRTILLGLTLATSALVLGGCASGNLPGSSFLPGTSQVRHIQTGVNASRHAKRQEVLNGPALAQDVLNGPALAQEVLNGPAVGHR